MHMHACGNQWEIWDKIYLTGLRRDSSFFDGTFGAEREFDRTLAKTEGPTELAPLVIVSRRTLTTTAAVSSCFSCVFVLGCEVGCQGRGWAE